MSAFEATANVAGAPNSNELSLRIGDVVLLAAPAPTSSSDLPALLLSGVNQRTGARGTFRLDHVRAVAMATSPTIPPPVARTVSSSESLRARARHISTSAGAPTNQPRANANTSALSTTIVGLEAFVRGDDNSATDEVPPSSPKSATVRPISTAAVASSSSLSSSPRSLSPPLSPSRSRPAKQLPPMPTPAPEVVSHAPIDSPPPKKAPRGRQNRKTIIQRVSAVFSSKRETEESRVKKLVKLVNKQFEHGKFEDALANLKAIIESPASESFRTRALFNIALCYAALKRFDEALKAVRDALVAGYDAFQNLQHPYFAPLQDNPEFFALLSEHLQKNDTMGAVIPIDQVTVYETAPRLSGTMMHEMLVSPDVEYEPIPCMDGEDDMDLAEGGDEDELEHAHERAIDEHHHHDDDDDEDEDRDDEEKLIDRRKLPPTPSAPPAEPPLDQELPQPVPPASEAMMKLAESANRLAAAGRAADARRVYARMLELHPKSGAVYALWANLEAQVNDKYESCRLLKLAAQCGFANWASIQRQPAFAPVLALPEYVEMMEEMRKVHSETRLD